MINNLTQIDFWSKGTVLALLGCKSQGPSVIAMGGPLLKKENNHSNCTKSTTLSGKISNVKVFHVLDHL